MKLALKIGDTAGVPGLHNGVPKFPLAFVLNFDLSPETGYVVSGTGELAGEMPYVTLYGGAGTKPFDPGMPPPTVFG
jgi:hypothetical protein